MDEVIVRAPREAAGSPFIEDLVEVPWKLDSEGMLLMPEGTALGISLNIDAMEWHSGQRF